MNNAIFKNRYHGILTSIGHGLGITIYAIFAVIGIGLIIKTNIVVFNGIKFFLNNQWGKKYKFIYSLVFQDFR